MDQLVQKTEAEVETVTQTAIEVAVPAVRGVDTLQAGRIIRVKIPTIIDGNLHLFERTCLVLGFEGVDKKADVTGIYVSRFAFNPDKFNPEYGLVIEGEEHRMAGIMGIRGSSVLRTDRIDLIPIDPFFLGSRIETVGYINDRETMLGIGDALIRGMTSGNGEASRGPRPRLEGSELRQTFESGMKPIFEKFPLAKLARIMTLLKRAGTDDYERALYQAMLLEMQRASVAAYAFRAAARAERLANPPEAATDVQAAPALRTDYVKPAHLRHGRRRNWSDQRIDRMVTRINEGVRKNRELLGLESERDPGHINGNAAAEAAPKSRRGNRTPFDATPVRTYFSVADNYVPIVPKNIKRGDVLILKVADILDPNDKRPAQRPCVVANVYEDKDTGEICGFEFYPRTRLRAHQFDDQYTSSFPNLYNRRIWDGGRIVTQQLIRVALDCRYFHPNTKSVRAINPKLLEELDEKRRACMDAGKTKPAFGLPDMPDNWRLRETAAPEITAAANAHAERVLKERAQQKPAILSAPQVGDIIMRKVVRDGHLIDVPVLIWGVWENKVTGLPAAFDCMRIDTSDRVKKAWGVDLDCLASMSDDVMCADTTMMDLVHNTEKFFDPCDVPAVIASVDDETLKTLESRRGTALIQCGDRKGTYPEFLRFDWIRTDGINYGFGIESLKSRKFAPDLAHFNTEPGYMKHKMGRDKTRAGMQPRRKRDGFKPKRAPV